MNLDRNNTQSGNFNVNITANGANLFGIKSNRTYNVKNIAAYTAIDGNRRNVWQWGGGIAGSNVLANGVFVSMNKVPTADANWTTQPYEAQYLKLYDVTPPPAPATPFATAYVVGTNVTFSWNAVSDADGGVSSYHLIIGTTPGGSNVFSATLSGTTQVAGGSFGQTLYAQVSAINNAGIEGSFSSVTSGTILLDPTADSDGDGMTNGAEAIAGTNPLDGNSVLKILSLSTGNLLTWSSVSGKTYQVHAASDLFTNFAPLSGIITGLAPTAAYLDTSATNAQRFYRVKIAP